MTDLIYKALGALGVFILGLLSAWLAMSFKRTKAAEGRTAEAENKALEAEVALVAEVERAAAKEEIERVANLTDDAADSEAHAAGVLSNRSPRGPVPVVDPVIKATRPAFTRTTEHTTPSAGYAPCTRPDGHDGPCTARLAVRRKRGKR